MRGLGALKLVSLNNRHSDLTIDAESAVGAAVEAHRDAGAAADDERTMGERVGANGSEDNGVDAGHQDRASGGERVGSGTGGSGDDDAVGLVLDDMFAVDAQLKADEAGDGALDDSIVEGAVRGNLLAVTEKAALDEGTRLKRTEAFGDSGESGIEFVEANFGEKAEGAEVDGEQRNFGNADGARRREQSAVTTEDEDELRLIAGYLGAGHDEFVGVVGSGLLIDVDAIVMGGEPVQSLGDDFSQLGLGRFGDNGCDLHSLFILHVPCTPLAGPAVRGRRRAGGIRDFLRYPEWASR